MQDRLSPALDAELAVPTFWHRLHDCLYYSVFHPKTFFEFFASADETHLSEQESTLRWKVSLALLLLTHACVGFLPACFKGDGSLLSAIFAGLGSAFWGGLWLFVLTATLACCFFALQGRFRFSTLFHLLAMAQVPWLFWSILLWLPHNELGFLGGLLPAVAGVLKLGLLGWFILLATLAVQHTYRLSPQQMGVLAALPLLGLLVGGYLLISTGMLGSQLFFS